MLLYNVYKAIKDYRYSICIMAGELNTIADNDNLMRFVDKKFDIIKWTTIIEICCEFVRGLYVERLEGKKRF